MDDSNLTLSKGETILTDGEHKARTRCGNRISYTPRQPVSMTEPEQAVLEEPPLPILPKDIPEWSFPIADLLPLTGGADGPHGGPFVLPFIVPILPGGGGGSTHTPTTPTTPITPITPPPVAPTPEPASLLLLSSGLVGLWLRRKQSK